MKKIFLLLVSAMFLMASCEKETIEPACVHSNVYYSHVDVYNNWGNVVDFDLSYDYCQQCDNNIWITNNVGANVYYNFQVIQDGIIVFTGYFNIPAHGSIHFNDAYYNCYSSTKFTEVVIW